MLDQNKSLISNTFKVINEKNTKCIILVIINTYNIEIDNPDIQLVTQ